MLAFATFDKQALFGMLVDVSMFDQAFAAQACNPSFRALFSDMGVYAACDPFVALVAPGSIVFYIVLLILYRLI